MIYKLRVLGQKIPTIIGLKRLHKIKETQLVHGKKSIATKIKTESGHLRVGIFVLKLVVCKSYSVQ